MVKRTGVIVGLSQDVTMQLAEEMVQQLRRVFPSVDFAIVTHGAGSITFEWEDGHEAES